MSQRTAYFLLLILSAFPGHAQRGLTGHPTWMVRTSFNQGFILVHRISIGHLVKGYPAIYAVDLVKPTLGNKLWQVENNLPEVGISAQCIDFKNPTQLGYAYVLAPFIEIPFRPAEKKARLIMRLCWGFSYITKKFDIAHNHKNIAIGSGFNSFVQFKWYWHVPLGERFRFEPGFAFSHVSNGKFRNPNLGLNVVSINAGLVYKIPTRKAVPAVTSVDSSAGPRKKHEILLFAAGGLNERYTHTPLLPTFVLSGAWQLNADNKSKFSVGLDAFYDKNYLVDTESRKGVPLEGMQQWRVAARVGYSYNVGRLSFPFEIGYYIIQHGGSPDGDFVNRIGVRYYMFNGLVAHFGLRAHFAVAYTFEAGLGYRFYL